MIPRILLTFLDPNAVLLLKNIKGYRWYAAASGPSQTSGAWALFLQGHLSGTQSGPFKWQSVYPFASLHASLAPPHITQPLTQCLPPMLALFLFLIVGGPSYHRVFAYPVSLAKASNHHANSYSSFTFLFYCLHTSYFSFIGPIISHLQVNNYCCA